MKVEEHNGHGLPQPETLVHALERNAKRLGACPALVMPDKTMVTWHELWAKVNECAAMMVGEGIGYGTLVFVAGLPSLNFYILLWACARLGAVFAPLNLQFTATEYGQYILPLTCLRQVVLISEPSFRNKFSTLPADIPRFSLSENDADDTWKMIRPSASSPEAAFPGPNDGIYLLSTSGSTGFPKPVLLPHRAAVSQALGIVARRNWQRDDRTLGIMPMFHIGGLSFIGTSAISGSAIHVMAGFDPTSALRRIEDEKITILGAFDILLDRLISLPEFTIDKMKSVRNVSFAGSPKYYRIIRSWGVEDISTAYAMTETTAVSAMPYTCSDEYLRQWSAGTVLPNVEVKIVDPTTGVELSDGESGEICVRGSGLFLGYLGQEAETARSFDSDGFFHTGDKGRLKDGFLFFEGRYKAMIKTGGENVSELEVENFLGAEFHEIRQVAVVGAPDSTWGEAVCAFIEFIPGAELSLDVIRGRAREKLAGFKLPRRLIVMQPNAWPQLATGKIDKAALRAQANANRTDSQSPVTSQSL